MRRDDFEAALAEAVARYRLGDEGHGIFSLLAALGLRPVSAFPRIHLREADLQKSWQGRRVLRVIERVEGVVVTRSPEPVRDPLIRSWTSPRGGFRAQARRGPPMRITIHLGDDGWPF